MDIAFTSVADLKHMIDAKELSIVEIVEYFFNRIDELNPKLNVFLALCREEAMEQAATQQEALEKGVLQGNGSPPVSMECLGLSPLKDGFHAMEDTVYLPQTIYHNQVPWHVLSQTVHYYWK